MHILDYSTIIDNIMNIFHTIQIMILYLLNLSIQSTSHSICFKNHINVLSTSTKLDCKLFKIWFQFLWKLDHLSAKHLKVNGLRNLSQYSILNFTFLQYWEEKWYHINKSSNENFKFVSKLSSSFYYDLQISLANRNWFN